MLSLAEVGLSESISLTKQFLFGNRCGHDPSEPRFFSPPEAHKLRPDVIQYAINNLEHFYHNPKKWLLSLLRVRESKRQQRSEAREREAKILGILLHYVDLASLRVGFSDGAGDFVSLDMRFFARQAGWRTLEDDAKDDERIKKGLRPINKGLKRTWRAIDNLKRAGYVNVSQQFKMTEAGDAASYQGLAAIKTVSQKLFTELGISSVRLALKRKEATKRLKEKKRAYLQKAEGLLASLKTARNNVVQPVKKVIGELLGETSPRYASTYAQNKERTFQLEQNRQAQCFELKQLPENKHLTASEFYEKFPHLRRRV